MDGGVVSSREKMTNNIIEGHKNYKITLPSMLPGFCNINEGGRIIILTLGWLKDSCIYLLAGDGINCEHTI